MSEITNHQFPTPTPAAPLSPLPSIEQGDGHGSDDAADDLKWGMTPEWTAVVSVYEARSLLIQRITLVGDSGHSLLMRTLARMETPMSEVRRTGSEDQCGPEQDHRPVQIRRPGPDRRIKGPCVPCARNGVIAVGYHVIDNEMRCRTCYYADPEVVEGLARELRSDELRDDADAMARRVEEA